MNIRWRNVWITGASSGIGRELALSIAASGAQVIVSARQASALQAIADQYPNIQSLPLDVTDRAAVKAAVADIWQRHGSIDLAIFSAALWYPMDLASFDVVQMDEAMRVNYLGVMNSVSALLPLMKEKEAGHLAILSSVAGYRGLPRSMAYGPSKAALINFAESIRPELQAYKIDMSVINPGFVDTPMTRRNDFPMPWLMHPDRACRTIIKGLKKRHFEIAFPWQMVTLLKFARILPYPLFFWFVRTFLTNKN